MAIRNTYGHCFLFVKTNLEQMIEDAIFAAEKDEHY